MFLSCIFSVSIWEYILKSNVNYLLFCLSRTVVSTQPLCWPRPKTPSRLQLLWHLSLIGAIMVYGYVIRQIILSYLSCVGYFNSLSVSFVFKGSWSYIFFRKSMRKFHRVRAYSRPILRSTIERCPFCQNYAKLYFDAKNLEKGLHSGWEGGEIFRTLFSKKVPFFHKKCPFWPISNAARTF